MFLENFVPGSLDRQGLGYGDLKLINERLVYCSITGFGSTGPSAHRAGYDVVASAVGGLMHITGSKVLYIFTVGGDICLSTAVD